MNDSFIKLVEFLSTMERLPGIALVFLCCVAVGYTLKRLPRFDNQYIPLVVMGLAITLTFMLAPPRGAGQEVLEWRTRQFCLGVISGALAWGSHAVLVKWLLPKVLTFLPGYTPPSAVDKPLKPDEPPKP